MQKIHLIGNAHIDPVWLWQWQEGFAEVKATFQSALDRLDEFEGFVFTCAGACYYHWVEANAPDMFEKIKKRVQEGRWVIVGGMWIQPDLNMPSGESLTRQLLYSQRYFMEKFGIVAKTGYNVDSFGQSAMLPQIYQNAGIDQYVWMRPNDRENPAVPQGAFRWQSPDGSEVLAFHIPDEIGGYTGTRDLTIKIERMQKYAGLAAAPMMCFYGVGNHGGGPTIEGLNTLCKYMAEDPNGGWAFFSSPDRYFEEIRPMKQSLPVWQEEMQHHASGCYSTFSPGKKANRRSENALLQAEKFSALSGALTGHQADMNALHRGWQNVMFNQFHDLMCGCSVRSGLEDALRSYDEALMIAAREENSALQKISWRIDTMMGNRERVRSKQEGILWGRDDLGTPVVLFNPHPYAVDGVAAVRGRLGEAVDAKGEPVWTQQIRAERTNGEDCFDTIVQAKIPAMGYRLIMMHKNDSKLTNSGVWAKETSVGNERISAAFDPHSGAMTSLVLDGREYLRAPASALLVDIEHCDTWAHGVFTFDKVVGTLGDAQIDVLESGPVRASLRVVTRRGSTKLTQIFRVYRGSDQIEIDAKLDLHDKHVLVKLEYPLAVSGGQEVSEVPLGAIERHMTGMEEPCARWFALGREDGGMAIINDGKHSYSCADDTLRFTVANSSMFADHYGQQYRDDTAEYLDMGEQKFRFAIVPYTGNWTDSGLNRRADQINQTIVSIQETYHEGPLSQEYEGMSIDAENVSLECLKRAENGQGFILRVRECCKKETEVCVQMPMLGREMKFRISPLEQRTYFLADDGSEPVRMLSTEEPVK